MNIETKFNIGEDVFLLYDNKIIEVKITNISISVSGKNIDYKHAIKQEPISIYYFYRDKSTTHSHKSLEYEIFKTKQELLNSL